MWYGTDHEQISSFSHSLRWQDQGEHHCLNDRVGLGTEKPLFSGEEGGGGGREGAKAEAPDCNGRIRGSYEWGRTRTICTVDKQ